MCSYFCYYTWFLKAINRKNAWKTKREINSFIDDLWHNCKKQECHIKLVNTLSSIRVLHHNHCEVYINTENFERTKVRLLIISVNKFSKNIGPYKEGCTTEIVSCTSTYLITWHTYIIFTCLKDINSLR